MYDEALWRRWDGDCLHLRQDSYHYTLCPFHNITQRGLQLTSLNALLGSAPTQRTDSLQLARHSRPMKVAAHGILTAVCPPALLVSQSVVGLVDDAEP